MESVFCLCLTQHVEGRFIVHDLTSSSKEIHVSGFDQLLLLALFCS